MRSGGDSWPSYQPGATPGFTPLSAQIERSALGLPPGGLKNRASTLKPVFIKKINANKRLIA